MLLSSLPLLFLFVSAGGSRECGLVEERRIVGGRPVSGAGYPWFVAMVKPGRRASAAAWWGSQEEGDDDDDEGGGRSRELRVACGASLITDRHLITAAHCYADEGGGEWTKKYRLYYLLRDRCGDQGERISGPQAKRVVLHPRFTKSALQHDLAVVTLEEKVPYTPICLPPGRNTEGGEGTVLGFGSVNGKAEYPCSLQFGRVRVFTRAECLRTTMRPDAAHLQNVICAGRLDGAVDSCDGDSGGPLQTMGSGGRYYLRGIVSFGMGCGRRNTPGIYTDTGAYLAWIQSQIKECRPNRPSPGGFWGFFSKPYFPPIRWPNWVGRFFSDFDENNI